MIDTEYRGGWGSYDRLSPGLRARCIADDREYEAARRAQERERVERAEYAEQVRIRAAVELAEQRGEFVDLNQVVRTRGECLGRTRSEFIAYISAVQDAEDARERARRRNQYDPEQHQALLMATNPGGVGRTREEARVYYSALADLQEMEAALRLARGLPTVDEEQAAAAQAERRDAAYAGRALAQRIRTVAQGAARRAVLSELERRFLDGEIGEEQFVAACQPERTA
jgi:hypothetical protein